MAKYEESKIEAGYQLFTKDPGRCAQTEHFAVGPTSRFRKEGIFLTCSKVSHGLVVKSEAGTICLVRPSRPAWLQGERS